MSFFDLNAYMADMVYEYIPGVKRVGSNKLNFRCPLCGDGKKKTSHRGWFYIDTGTYFCWNAGCVASESGMQGLKFLSLISGKPIPEIKSELIKKAGSFSNAVNKPKIKNINQSIFNELVESKNSKIEIHVEPQLSCNKIYTCIINQNYGKVKRYKKNQGRTTVSSS